MATTFLKPAPRDMPYPVIRDSLMRSVLIQKSDPVYATDASSDGVTTEVFRVPAGTMVLRVYPRVTVASTGAVLTIILGDSDDTNRYMQTNTGAVYPFPTTTGFVVPHGNSVASSDGMFTGEVPHLYTAEGIISAVMDKSSTGATIATQGTIEFFVEYVSYADQLPWTQY